jgi:hypothetical protein
MVVSMLRDHAARLLLAGFLLAGSACNGGGSAPAADSGGGDVAVADAAPTPADAAAERAPADLAGVEAPPASPSRFPDTTSTIGILADQLPNLSSQQMQFAATRYVGSQKLLLGVTRALRAINPNFRRLVSSPMGSTGATTIRRSPRTRVGSGTTAAALACRAARTVSC